MLAHKKRKKMNLRRGILLFSLIIMSSIIAIPIQYSEAGGNNAPVLLPIGDQKEDEGDTSQIHFSATDDSDDILTFTSSPLPRFAVLMDNGDRTAKLVLTTSLNDAGTYEITITVTDTGSPNLSDSETFDLVINDDGDAGSPELMIEDTVDQVLDMVEDGKLNEGQAISLIQKLESAVNKLEDGKDNAAYNMLQSFINHMEAFIKSGALTYKEAQPLIDAARTIQDTLF